jgi:hypothetical protein
MLGPQICLKKTFFIFPDGTLTCKPNTLLNNRVFSFSGSRCPRRKEAHHWAGLCLVQRGRRHSGRLRKAKLKMLLVHLQHNELALRVKITLNKKGLQQVGRVIPGGLRKERLKDIWLQGT